MRVRGGNFRPPTKDDLRKAGGRNGVETREIRRIDQDGGATREIWLGALIFSISSVERRGKVALALARVSQNCS